MKILDVYGGDELEQINEVMGPYVLLDGGRLLVYADGASLGIYDVPNSKSLAAGLFAKNTIWTLAVESSGKYVAAATRDGWISLWQIVPIGEGGEMTARPISETKLYGNNEYVNEMEFFEDGQKLLAVSSKGNIDVVSLPDVKRTRTMGVLGAKLDSLSRISGTDKFVLLTKRHSAKGKVLTVLDLAADTGMVVDERRQFLSVVPVADTKGKLLFVSGRGMWTKELHTTGAEESLSNLMARIASIALPLQSTATITPRPSAKNVLPNTRVESVGVYEGTLPGGRKRRPRERVSGTVTVTVGLQRAPLALVLSSYEPVNWIIRSGGARVTHVLLSGRAESTVIGVPEADIMRIGGGRGYPSTGNRRNRGQSQRDTAALNASAMQYLGRGIDRFQGAYTGSSFSIGSQSTAGTGVAQKWVDSNGQVHYGDRAP